MRARTIDAIIKANIALCLEGYQEPMDIELEEGAFLQLVAEAQRIYPEGIGVGRPCVRLPIYARPEFGSSFDQSPRAEKVNLRISEVMIDAALIDGGIKIHTPMGASTVRAKPAGRQHLREQLARHGH